jgi:hypothetical protein
LPASNTDTVYLLVLVLEHVQHGYVLLFDQDVLLLLFLLLPALVEYHHHHEYNLDNHLFNCSIL